ncbi:TPA: hypothetical protein ACKRZ5_001364 [Proteus mirabilis]
MRNDVYNNRYHVPVISSPNPANEAMMRDSVNIYVMINNEFIGHVGLVIGNGEDALLYDPAGSYTGCKNNQCEDGSYTLRGSGDFFQYPDFNWDDYLSYQLWDGDDIVIIEFVIPREQAEHITKLIYELGGANALFCASYCYIKILGKSFIALFINCHFSISLVAFYPTLCLCMIK